MELLAILTLILAIVSTDAQDLPEIGFISPDAVTDIGGDVELTCTIRKQQQYPVSWIRLGKSVGASPVVISRGPELQVADQRFSLTQDKDAGSSSYTLAIKKVRKSDATKYQCQVMVSLNNQITKSVEVKVKMQPVIKEGLSPTMRVVEGQPADLECQASGYPIPTVTWTRPDKSLLVNGKASYVGSKLPLTSVRREDRGRYECYVHNGVGSGQKRAITLEVEFSPKVKAPRPRIPQALDYEADLTCEIEAYPPPSIIWTKDDGPITNNGSFYVSHFAKEDDKIVSSVKIYAMDANKYGKYDCAALNKHGKDVKEIEVYETAMPICPPLCGDVDLNWSTHSSLPNFNLVLMTTAIALLASTFRL